METPVVTRVALPGLREALPTFAGEVVRLFERSLDDSSRTLGYHGTSLQALEVLIKTGMLPCTTRLGEHSDILHKFSFFPNADNFPDHHLAHTFPAVDTIRERCGSYAAELAEKHFLAERWGLSIDNTAHLKAIDELLTGQFRDPLGPNAELTEPTREILKHLGLASKIIKSDVELALRQKGVLLAIDLSAAAYGVIDGDKGEGDLRIHVPGGLPLSCICGIEPFGQRELDYLEQLQDGVRSAAAQW